jgi:hypothetical protein
MSYQEELELFRNYKRLKKQAQLNGNLNLKGQSYQEIINKKNIKDSKIKYDYKKLKHTYNFESSTPISQNNSFDGDCLIWSTNNTLTNMYTSNAVRSNLNELSVSSCSMFTRKMHRNRSNEAQSKQTASAPIGDDHTISINLEGSMSFYNHSDHEIREELQSDNSNICQMFALSMVSAQTDSSNKMTGVADSIISTYKNACSSWDENQLMLFNDCEIDCDSVLPSIDNRVGKDIQISDILKKPHSPLFKTSNNQSYNTTTSNIANKNRKSHGRSSPNVKNMSQLPHVLSVEDSLRPLSKTSEDFHQSTERQPSLSINIEPSLNSTLASTSQSSLLLSSKPITVSSLALSDKIDNHELVKRMTSKTKSV